MVGSRKFIISSVDPQGMEPGPLHSAGQARVVTACNVCCVKLRHNEKTSLVARGDHGNSAMRSATRASLPLHGASLPVLAWPWIAIPDLCSEKLNCLNSPKE